MGGPALSKKEAVALTLHSGAAGIAPFVRSPDVHAYFVGDRERLVKTLDLGPVESAGAVHRLEPYDEGVFYRTRTIRGGRVVSPRSSLSTSSNTRLVDASRRKRFAARS